jgi:hypothetical protein
VNELIRQMGPFARAATPALEHLGATAGPGIPAIKGALPIVKDLRSFGRQIRPVGKTLADVLESFQHNDGVERLMDYIYYQAMAVNGFDSVSHFLRAGLIINTCSTYAVEPVPGCSSNFDQSPASAAAAKASSPSDRILRLTAAVLRGADPAKLLRAERAQAGGAAAPLASAPSAPATPAVAPGPEVTPEPVAAPAATPEPTQDLLDYLFGDDAGEARARAWRPTRS